MREPAWDTPLTRLFGIPRPILAGGLHWLSTPDYVAAAAHAGMVGFLTAASYAALDDLRDAIRRTRDLCDDRPWGVNISMLPKLAEGDRAAAIAQLVAAEEVPFVETSGRNPGDLLPALRSRGAKVIHKVPTVRHAMKAQAAGVDAVAVVGAECGGHPGVELIGSFVQAAMAARDLSIPLAVGGGIGTGAQLAAALALGADGVVIGTRFLVAEEIAVHDGYKHYLTGLGADATTLVLGSLRNTMRVLANETSAHVQELERGGAGLAELMPHISGQAGLRAYHSGDWRTGLLAVGQAIAFADRIEPLASIVARIEAEAVAALDGLASKVGR